MKLSQSDISQHTLHAGVDIYPPVRIPEERTHLNVFFEEARDRHPEWCHSLAASDAGFRISGRFGDKHGRTCEPVTFELTKRGPVFSIPLVIADLGTTALSDKYLEVLEATRKLFFACVPDRKILRFGLVRKVMFNTGDYPSLGILGAPDEFASAELVGGSAVYQYRDDRYNVRITAEPMRAIRTTRIPLGARVDEPAGFGLGVTVDVNNHEIKPQLDADIQLTVDRAESLWPESVMEFLERRGGA